MIKEQDRTEARSACCGRRYPFSRGEGARLRRDIDKPDKPSLPRCL